MLPEDIDDLFRQQLDGHATPPAPDLWARLPLPTADPDPVDTAFQTGLHGHATPPRRELWERLEDEHLRPQPRRRRAVAWWQYSVAAMLLLGLLLGGGLWWRAGYQHATTAKIAQLPTGEAKPTARQLATNGVAKNSPAQPQLADRVTEAAAASTLQSAAEKKQESFATQATTLPALPSSTPIATTTRPRRPATADRVAGTRQRQQPDAAAGALATTGGRKTPTGQHPSTPLVAPATRPAEAPTLATATSTPMPEIIEVEVRRGPESPRPTAAAVVAVAEPSPAPARRRGLRLGGLLRQADHLVHGEPVNLAEATSPVEIMTVQARLGGRLISKTIQL